LGGAAASARAGEESSVFLLTGIGGPEGSIRARESRSFQSTGIGVRVWPLAAGGLVGIVGVVGVGGVGGALASKPVCAVASSGISIPSGD
jgi:hypothetical protein